jgi:hypothetical protein
VPVGPSASIVAIAATIPEAPVLVLDPLGGRPERVGRRHVDDHDGGVDPRVAHSTFSPQNEA